MVILWEYVMNKEGNDVSNELKCNNCGKVYKTEQGLAKHIKLNKCESKEQKKLRKLKEKERLENDEERKRQQTCKFCGRYYKTERGILDHKCVKKRRYEELKLPEGRIALICFQILYKTTTNSTTKTKTAFDFINSPYYNNILDFGKFVTKNRIKRYESYFTYLLKYDVPAFKWCDERIFSLYIRSFIKAEPMESAIENSFKTMSKWADENNRTWTEYFKENSNNAIIRDFKMGLMSPWVLYNSISGEYFIQRLNKYELDRIYEYIDPVYWEEKFSRHPALTKATKTTLRSVGL